VNLEEYRHNWPTSLSPEHSQALSILRAACESLPFYLWPQKSVKASADNAKTALKYQSICGLQALMNEWFRQELVAKGFRAEVSVRREKRIGSNQKVDFAVALDETQFLMVEVEFGNTSSLDRDLKKLCDAYHWGRSSMGVLICPKSVFGKVITGGDATFEQVVTRLTEEHPNTNASPLLVLGLDHRDTFGVDMSASQLTDAEQLSGNRKNKVEVIGHVVRQHRAGVAVLDIGMPGVAQARGEQAIARFATRMETRQVDMFC
jgi:hypothetical protein